MRAMVEHFYRVVQLSVDETIIHGTKYASIIVRKVLVNGGTDIIKVA